jgi:hypothetical protein
MPPEIAAHYRDYNFVNAFSSPAERRVLTQSTTAADDRRLKAVARAMGRLAARTEELDPGIMFEPRADDSLPRHESEFGSAVVRIASWHLDAENTEAWIELEVTTLDEGTAGVLLANFDRLTQGGESRPEVDKLLAFARRPPLRTAVRHQWHRIDGEWRRAAAVLILTAQ